jgi:preprotein translocase subunit SecA
MTILKLTPEMAAPVEAEAPREMQLRGADEGIQQFAGASQQSTINSQRGGSNVGDAPAQQPIHNENTVGRNDPCPCGAKHEDGRPKKYKQCHGR